MAVIIINRTAAGGQAQKMANALDNIRAGRAALRDVLASADQAISAPDYSDFETIFGVPTGDGETVRNLLGSALADMEYSDALGEALIKIL